jgi:hypothetical protein
MHTNETYLITGGLEVLLNLRLCLSFFTKEEAQDVGVALRILVAAVDLSSGLSKIAIKVFQTLVCEKHGRLQSALQRKRMGTLMVCNIQNVLGRLKANSACASTARRRVTELSCVVKEAVEEAQRTREA